MSGAALASFRRLLFEISDPADLYRVRRYLGNSLFLFFFSLLDLFLGLVIAAILTRKPYGARLLRVVYLFPSILSAAAATIMWVMVLHPRFGLVNQALRTIGLGGWTQPWLSQVKMLPFAPMALYAVALIGVWGASVSPFFSLPPQSRMYRCHCTRRRALMARASCRAFFM